MAKCYNGSLSGFETVIIICGCHEYVERRLLCLSTWSAKDMSAASQAEEESGTCCQRQDGYPGRNDNCQSGVGRRFSGIRWRRVRTEELSKSTRRWGYSVKSQKESLTGREGCSLNIRGNDEPWYQLGMMLVWTHPLPLWGQWGQG